VRRTSRILFLLIAVALCAAVPVFAQEAAAPPVSQYTLGDQTMSINAGLFIPLFLLPTGTWFLAGDPAHLSLGAVGSLSWAAYVAPEVRVGIDIAGSFGMSPNSNTLLMLPFVAKASYIFSFYPFELPVTFGAGMNILRYVDDTTIDLLLRPSVGLYWIFDSSWSFGLNLNYWFDMQFAATAADSRQANFLEVTLGALYHY
jgi:hypothetical protein